MPTFPPPGSRARRLFPSTAQSALRGAVAKGLALALILAAGSTARAEIPPIPRVLPPEGIEIPADVRERLETRLAAAKKRLTALPDSHYTGGPDVEVFTKAVELALLHREFYAPRDFSKADWALDQADSRLTSLEKDETHWTRATGLVVRGYRSLVDESAQPYGLVIPEGHDFEKPCPLYVWLHGRGDKQTDLHFLQERATKTGQIAPSDAIVVHPFGRQCVGFKHAAEVDVLDVVRDVKHGYKIDPARIVLIGFSMGGAGAWHLGAHYPNNWVAVAPGAGFAETARYQRLSPDRYPPWYEQKLWQAYDVPGYVRNLFNTEVIAYSGELDKQIQAARVMEEAYKAEGRELTHLIGPGVEHKYEPKTLDDLLSRLEKIAAKGREKVPRSVYWQSPTLKYSHSDWVTVLSLEEHWKNSRVDAEIVSPEEVKVLTKNVARLQLDLGNEQIRRVDIDGQVVTIPKNAKRLKRGIQIEFSPWPITLCKNAGAWRYEPEYDGFDYFARRKRPGITGPIDDCFTDSFVVVTPTGKSRNAAFQAWVEFELEHLRNRWRALMRAELPEMRDIDCFPEKAETGFELQIPTKNLVLWGDFDSNLLMNHLKNELPLYFEDQTWTFGGQVYDGNKFVPALIFPRRLAEGVYGNLVLNSGLTFREGHDRTNSLQNPKLPDWAIIDMTQPPDAFSPGRIHDAGFFDENWQLKGPPKAP